MNPSQLLRLVRERGIEQVRIAWCDLHGELRAKAIEVSQLESALHTGLGLVGTLALKDTSDRTAFKVFEPDGLDALPGGAAFAQAGNLLAMPIAESYRELPWSPKTAWLQAHMVDTHGEPVVIDSRAVLQRALQRLADQGLAMRCGLEVEFHIYKIESTRPEADPDLAAWPGLPPAVSMIHPGYRLLSERCLDMAHTPLSIVRETALALGLPLSSIEIEFGPSQVEAVFDVSDALTAADHMVLFKSATMQALRRAGYHASFMCRPPLPNIMSSGWHLHQSFVDAQTGENILHSTQTALSTRGQQMLAGLLAHARAVCALANPAIDAYARFRPHALAPYRISWGVDNRGALLRVIPAGQATRFENRIGSPMANPYLYIASQIHAALDGLSNQLSPPPATDSPYAEPSAGEAHLPSSLQEAIEALRQDHAMQHGFGPGFIDYYARIKQQEIKRYAACTTAEEQTDWLRREYFARF
jgi:glutamine synthetase